MHIWKILLRRRLCWGIDDADAFAEVERETSGNKWSLPVASGADPLSRRIVRTKNIMYDILAAVGKDARGIYIEHRNGPS